MVRAITSRVVTFCLGNIYVVGGNVATTGLLKSRQTKEVDVYSIAKNKWTVGAPLHDAKPVRVAEAIGDTMYVIGK